jgi:hypothetical protein
MASVSLIALHLKKSDTSGAVMAGEYSRSRVRSVRGVWRPAPTRITHVIMSGNHRIVRRIVNVVGHSTLHQLVATNRDAWR